MIVWVVVLLCLLILSPMVRSPWGRVLRAIREDEDAAASLGKNVFAYKLQALALGAALAGVAGCFYAWQFSFFSPDDFQPLLTFFAWMIVILGGTGRDLGRPGRRAALRRHLRGDALLRLPAVLVARLRRPRLRPADPDRAGADRPDAVPAAGDPRQARGDGARVTALLEVRGVVKHYGGVRAVDGATFAVERGSITALIGPNGAGKSTLFNIVSGFLRGDSGVVRLDGRRIDRLPPHRVARLGLVRTFQTARALGRMTVLDNMVLAAPGHPGERLGGVVLRRRASRAFERRARERALELLALIRLDGLADDYAGTLSGGQRKLLDLVRALMAEPRILLLDEPMAGVNPTLREQLLEHVLELRAETGVTFLLVEHDLDFVMRASDRVIVLANGARDLRGHARRGARRRARDRRLPPGRTHEPPG